MVHEPFFRFRWGSPRENAAAVAHRLMTVLLLAAASQVWISIPHWEGLLRPYAFGRRVPFRWLPVPSNIPARNDSAGVQTVRRRYADGDRLLIGHFGTFGSSITALLEPILCACAGHDSNGIILLIGKGSEQFRHQLVQKEPRLAGQVQATGALRAEELSSHLAACDLLIQPYPDGVSTRRGSFMAGLANGKPIVTTTGWLTEPFWIHCDAVALAPAGNTDAFLDQLRRLRQDATERLRAGSAAAKLYQERFDISHTVSTLRQAETSKESECAFS
jgi:glycosyltransferase involved in cell wall biosynthesis